MNEKINKIKSIYLDWNIFQDIFQNRKSIRLIENLNFGRRKGYSTPYSHAHISDLLRCSNLDYVRNDLKQLETVTEQWCIGPHQDGSGFCIDRIPPHLIYEAMAKDQRNTPDPKVVRLEFQPYKVEVRKLSSENILIPYLKRFNNMMSPDLMTDFIETILENALSDYKLQRDFRNSFIEVVNLNQPATKKIRDILLYRHIFSTKEDIEENFTSIFQSFLSIDGRSTTNISEEDKFTTAYGILDFFPVFKEKIERKNNMNNMLTDALHVYIASKCSYFICGDRKLVEKAKLIYRSFNVKTRVFHVDDFIEKVEL